MTISEWLMSNMHQLGEAEVDSPRRDALVLLEDTIQKDRVWVLSHPEYELDTATIDKLAKLIKRRVAREPLAYIRSKAWFYGRFFEVNKNVLIPRPESENIIEILKILRPKKLIDIGTGSGALAITIKLELPSTEVIATDISDKALEVAENNAKNHKVNINFVHSDLFQNIENKIDQNTVIVANLPYVPKDLITSPEIEAEPKLALFSGEDGLDHYRIFWRQIAGLKTKPKYVITESLQNQHRILQDLAIKAGYKKIEENILSQLFEII